MNKRLSLYEEIKKEYELISVSNCIDELGSIKIELYERENDVSYYTVILTDNIVTQILHSTQSSKLKQALSRSYPARGKRVR